jgi:2-oxoacid:acceptor oxidoreductase gamma subunit (pyruvate/2-ketoisovalerate family)
MLTEVRWHARAGQGAKTAAQALALAGLAGGESVQAFPEYGPERRGAPLRAFTRLSDRPIRRHDGVTDPDLVVVIEPSLVHEVDVTEGLRPDGVVLVNAEEVPPELEGLPVRLVPAATLAEPRSANIVMLGAAAAVLGAPALELVQEAAVQTLGAKTDPEKVKASVEAGYRWLS